MKPTHQEIVELEEQLARVTAERDELNLAQGKLFQQIDKLIKEKDELLETLASRLVSTESINLKVERDKLAAENEKLRAALKALLFQCSNIEALGEWEAGDINRTMRKTVRAKVDAVLERARAALAEQEPRQTFQQEQWEWVKATFPGETRAGVFKHLWEELEELESSPDDEKELADCFLLIQCLASHAGVDLMTAARAKFEECKLRKWKNIPGVGFRTDKSALAKQEQP